MKSENITIRDLSLIINKNERLRCLKRLKGSISPARARAWIRDIKKSRNEWK